MKTRTRHKNDQSFINIILSIYSISIFLLWLLYGEKTKESFDQFVSVGVIVFLGIVSIYILFIIFSFIVSGLKSRLINIPRFQKVRNTSSAEYYLNDNNFLNHHNYFENKTLERDYNFQRRLKIVSGNITFFSYMIFLLFVPEVFVSMLIFAILLFIGCYPFLIRDGIIGEGKKETKIYFRKIKPTAFQKIKNNLFFY